MPFLFRARQFSQSLSDGLLILRYLFGIRGTALFNGVIATDATRTNASEIESYLARMAPNIGK